MTNIYNKYLLYYKQTFKDQFFCWLNYYLFDRYSNSKHVFKTVIVIYIIEKCNILLKHSIANAYETSSVSDSIDFDVNARVLFFSLVTTVINK